MSRTVTLPQTTIFTPPASCVTHWTYEAEYYNSVPGGLLMQNVLRERLDTDCFPPRFTGHGREPAGQLFSPGACPDGYTTPALFRNRETTTAVCCQEGFSYLTTITTVNHGGSTSLVFEGCVSTYDDGETDTTVAARAHNTDLNITSVSGPLTMWGQPVTVAFQSEDLTLFTTNTAAAVRSSTRSATPTPATRTETPTTPSPTAPAASETPAETAPLSSGAKAGIGVGAAAGALFLLAGLVALFLWRRRRRRRLRAKDGEAAVELPEKPWRISGGYHQVSSAPVEAEADVPLRPAMLDRGPSPQPQQPGETVELEA